MKTNRLNPCDEIRRAVQQDPSRTEDLPDAWARHVKECAACQVEVQAARRLLEMLRGAGEGFELHANPEKLAQEAIRRANAGEKAHRPMRALAWKPALAVTLGLALATAGFWWWQEPSSKAGQPMAESETSVSSTFRLETAERIGLDGKRQILPQTAAEIASSGDERILLTFSEGTRVQLNEDTRVRLADGKKRALQVERGEILVDVVRQQGLEPLRIQVPDGRVDVVGTRLLVRALAGMSVVSVLRGHVVAESGGRKADVHAGGEALLRNGREPLVQAAASLGGAMEWAQSAPKLETEDPGIGSLRARRPGAAQDAEQALQLVDRTVDVRIQGRVARTEIEEEFANDRPETLEGIYAFPLPPDAQIAALDLLVDGKWEHGAIVEKSRGDRIWAGVIRNAAPKAQKKEIVEYVWVPGPWRDPALLNWKKGSEFEMKIFPIPGKGSRRVRIAYTQILEPVPGGLRYVLPLPSGGKVAAARFRFTAHLGGLAAPNLRVFPYAVTSARTENGVRMEFEASNFAARGNLVVEIPETDPDREIRAWAYRPEPGLAAGSEDFGLVALKPRLPAFAGTRSLDWVFVVDRSWGTRGVRLQFAARMIASLIEQLEAGHRVSVWACNHACSLVHAQAGASRDTAQKIRETVSGLESIGSTSMDAVLDTLEAEIRQGRLVPASTRIVYVSDGVLTTGETQTDRISERIGKKLPGARFSTVALGGSVDEAALSAWARAGGGSALFLKAGEAPELLAGKLLSRQLAVPLENVRIEFPAGARELAPKAPERLWPGEELLLAFRGTQASGDLVLTGTLDGVPFSRRYSLEMAPHAGNSFVPRLWAQGRIRDLEAQAQTPETIKEIVNLSRTFHVLSRHTSLLVLESPAMAKAFGVEDTRPKVDFTGLEDVRESSASGPADEETGLPGGGAGRGKMDADFGTPASAPPMPSMPKASKMDRVASVAESEMPPDFPRRRPPPRMIRMRKEWYRKASISEPRSSEAAWTALQQKKAEYEKNPESRDRLSALVQAALAASRIDEAQELVGRWLQKDPMDAQALLAQADVAFLKGETSRAVDYIESAVDVDPSPLLQARLFALYRAAENPQMACAHALPRAISDASGVEAAVEAARCTGNADRFLAALKPADAARARKLLDAPAPVREPSDHLNLEALWEGDGQVDLAVVTPDGRVVNFTGGARRVSAAFAESKSMEKLAISMERRGEYRIWAVPRKSNGGRPLQGRVKITSYGVSRSFPFAVADKPQAVAVVEISLAFRLVPAPLPGE